MRYATGKWFGLVTTQGCIILAPESQPTMVYNQWTSLIRGDGFSGAVRHVMTIAESSLDSLTDFAIVICEDEGAHVAVRGRLYVKAITDHGVVKIDGGNVMTWREEIIPGVTSLAVFTADACSTEIPMWPLREGIAQVSMIEVLADDTSQDHHQPPPLEEQVEVRETPMVAPHLDVSLPNSGSATQATLMPEDYAASEADDTNLHSTTFYRGLFSEEPLPPSQQDVSPRGSFEDHDGLTAASVACDSDLDDHDGMTVLSAPQLDEGDGFDDHDGMTVLGAPDPSLPTPHIPSRASPLVLARICPVCTSPNSTRRVDCRECGKRLEGDAVQVPRPVLGQLKLPNGDIIPIDHPLIIGRMPEASRFSNNDIPILVRVDDPHVSSTHLKVDLEDWSVLVTNLGRNGTILRRTGHPDRRFTGNEQVIAQAGDVYYLSSELGVTIVELT